MRHLLFNVGRVQALRITEVSGACMIHVHRGQWKDHASGQQPEKGEYVPEGTRPDLPKLSSPRSHKMKQQLCTYNFPLVQIVLSLTSVPLEPWAHVHTGPDHGDRFVEAFGNERVVHLALRNRSLALCLSLFHKLGRRVSCPRVSHQTSRVPLGRTSRAPQESPAQVRLRHDPLHVHYLHWRVHLL